MEVDRSLELLLDKLEEAGKLDNTLIVATGDHVPYFNIDTLEELAGTKFGSSEAMESLDESNINFDVYKSALFFVCQYERTGRSRQGLLSSGYFAHSIESVGLGIRLQNAGGNRHPFRK